MDACGKLLAPIKTNKDPYGITTKDDGIIYINPTEKSAAGQNATLAKFASAIGMEPSTPAKSRSPAAIPTSTATAARASRGTSTWMTWGTPQEPTQDGVLQNKKGRTGRSGGHLQPGLRLRRST